MAREVSIYEGVGTEKVVYRTVFSVRYCITEYLDGSDLLVNAELEVRRGTWETIYRTNINLDNPENTRGLRSVLVQLEKITSPAGGFHNNLIFESETVGSMRGWITFIFVDVEVDND